VIVAGLQLDVGWESPGESFARARVQAARAAAAGARLLVLPEMFATGFTMNAELAASFGGASRELVVDLARGLGVWLAAGLVESGRERPRNACLMVSPAGNERLTYHKIHPFSLAGEERHFEAGDRLVTVEVEGVRVTPVICYDLRFPELFRIAAEHTDLFLVLANWPERRAHAWRTLLQARAMDSQAYVLGVNRVGEADGHPHRGDSALVDPSGAVLASVAGEEGLVLGEVRVEEVVRARERFGFLADRRPDLYCRLGSGGGSE
jgi:predicted amidohydrolase